MKSSDDVMTHDRGIKGYYFSSFAHYTMDNWSSSSSSPISLYQSFNPDGKFGLARLLELLVYVRGGAISVTTLVSILIELNEGIGPIEVDYVTFIEKHCQNLSLVIVDGLVKCKFRFR